MRSFWFGVLVCAALFVACGDDDSSFATRPSDGSSSSAKSSSSSAKSSSSRIGCKTETEDNCEYGELVDDRDGQTYKTVKIGDQVWMVENLNFETDSSFCYKNTAEYCEKYGRLYRWAAAVGKSESECGYGNECSLPSGNIQGVCPKGWHLPSKAEWETLFTAVGGKDIAGKKLKSMSGWEDYEGESGNGTDSFGFSALSAGFKGHDWYYGDGGYDAFFWSSTEDDSYYAYNMNLGYCDDTAFLNGDSKLFGFSVRCIQD